MEDQRLEPRTHLIYYLRVFDPKTHSLFGHVVDLSKNGLLITSDKPMERHSQYRLEIEDVSMIDRLHTIGINVECRWCQPDQSNELFDAGFRLVQHSTQVDDMLNNYQ